MHESVCYLESLFIIVWGFTFISSPEFETRLKWKMDKCSIYLRKTSDLLQKLSTKSEKLRKKQSFQHTYGIFIRKNNAA